MLKINFRFEVFLTTSEKYEYAIEKFSNDGRQCVSASSDGTVRLWSIGEQRVIRVFQISEQGIWTLAVDPNFRWVYAAGKQADITGKNNYVLYYHSNLSTRVSTGIPLKVIIEFYLIYLF